MASFDLSDYSLGELKGLLFDIDKEIRERQRLEREQARERARQQILSIADAAGIAVDKLLGDSDPG
jgi:DNA-binding protein H-NS